MNRIRRINGVTYSEIFGGGSALADGLSRASDALNLPADRMSEQAATIRTATQPRPNVDAAEIARRINDTAEFGGGNAEHKLGPLIDHLVAAIRAERRARDAR